MFYRKVFEQTTIHHYATTTGIPSYFLGLILGYLIANGITFNPKIKVLTYLHVVIALFCVYTAGQLSYLTESDNISVLLKYMLGPTIRTLISTTTCLLFYSCYNGIFPLATSFFSIRLFELLSKLSYSTFMMHYLVLWYDLGTLRQPAEIGYYQLIYETIGFYAVSIFFGYLLYIFVEAPALRILKLAFVHEEGVPKKVT